MHCGVGCVKIALPMISNGSSYRVARRNSAVETKHIEPTPLAFWIEGDTMSTRLYSDTGDIHLDDVVTVHASLGKFVDGMLVGFPELQQFVIIPLWDAAGPDPATVQPQQV